MTHTDVSHPLPRVSLVLDHEKRELLTTVLTPDREHPLRLCWEVVVKRDYVPGDDLPPPFKADSIGKKFRVSIRGTAFGNGVFVMSVGLVLSRRRLLVSGFTTDPAPYLLMAVAKDVPPAEYAVRAEAAIARGVKNLSLDLDFETTLTIVPAGQYEVPEPLPQ